MPCKLCRSQGLELHEAGAIYHGGDHGATDDSTKAMIFHGACELCDSPNFSSHVKLCDRCKHLRLYHLMRCYSSEYDKLSGHFTIFRNRDRSVSFNFTPSSRHCDLCVFVASHDTTDLRTSTSRKQVAFHIYLNGTSRFQTGGRSHTLCAIYRSERSYRIMPFINWSWVQYWVSREEMKADGNRLALRSALQDVRVIDVFQHCVVPLPSKETYLALSYVWGNDAGDVFQCKRSNVESLNQPQSLQGIDLPRTISDAMIACKELGRRWLWVDRLCIIQDDPKITTQLEQMAAIYHQAAFTIVAAAGEGASHGLAGVRRPRSSTRPPLKFHNDFEIVDEMPSLAECLSHGSWQDRGWTYQEQEASSALLYFSDHGLFHLNKNLKFFQLNAEGRTAQEISDGVTHDLQFVTDYSRRKLTHVSDRLRAISGILQALYGDQSYCGMPFDNFDIALLWHDEYEEGSQVIEAGIFPTWSWLACPGVVGFPHRDLLYGLASWGQCTKQSTSTESHWTSIPRSQYSNIKTKEKVRFDQDTQVAAALAWLHGCTPGDIPSWLALDCSRDDYVHRLARSWRGGNRDLWNELLTTHKKRYSFDSPEIRTLRKVNRVITHTQKASFRTDWRTRCITYRLSGSSQKATSSVIRTCTGRVAGFVESDRRLEVPSDNAEATFIALSVTSEFESPPTFENTDESKPTPSGIYGCACAQATESALCTEHIRECPKHPDFYFVEQRLQLVDDWSAAQTFEDEFELAHDHHLRAQGYRDYRGQMLHSHKCPPKLNVMMVGIKPGVEDEGTVYQRLGIGKIYLKTWVEAEPSFDTMVLE